MVDALDELLAPPRLEGLLEELRASDELPDVVAALDAGNVEEALNLLVGGVPDAEPVLRDQLREVAVAIFEGLDPEDPLVGTYRRRLAAALY
jgi:thioredoxin-like negative regulator of GroEL